ncbi:TIGR03747 family integrating conjugative element membrane protein [Serratia fonticola]|uniref:TIGR03747 family integrating conjugative element membrane protein n=1 Tax=Serratia fonticola TaxID=47917 RepID=UPI001377F317|nr:TIGR03747 family integrating conjugative element membrane protein [Serratia fonticola]NCG54034.1 TIGR03747 family integrating conjugative element membrane protein [Serratia fonticola]
MAEAQTQRAPQSGPAKNPGLLSRLLWYWPLGLMGVLLASLFLSLVFEYLGMVFLWPEEGMRHSQQMLVRELEFLSAGFTRSLMHSAPVETGHAVIGQLAQWLLVDSGVSEWRYRGQQPGASALQAWGGWLYGLLQDYLLASVYVCLTFVVRLMILTLSLPLFVLALLVGLTEGLVRRDLRRFGAGYESSFIYHHAKRSIKTALYTPWLLYLSLPFTVYPNLILLPAATWLGLAVCVTTATFKKYI